MPIQIKLQNFNAPADMNSAFMYSSAGQSLVWLTSFAVQFSTRDTGHGTIGRLEFPADTLNPVESSRTQLKKLKNNIVAVVRADQNSSLGRVVNWNWQGGSGGA
ncbi:hypothetical protein TSAR_011561 [Trichomalopsis sarcophagae]|uniref:Uncharacterized protein n=1 Tax=Trichomalopsis sarcophagae TaxID=543379 RepID=A0A232EQH6_9HYME|nr:hypothetical protein TSAR_011561 [Trichomalopsis sarcophagae]